ncbi:MAG: hypothetical protein Q7R41_15645 [Phycisphaerales bacterium]|nr:hypothetical protein [Phycisphaerales bacterium]
MPKRTDIKNILIIGSGPIVIGQGAEFDYFGDAQADFLTRCCLTALRQAVVV